MSRGSIMTMGVLFAGLSMFALAQQAAGAAAGGMTVLLDGTEASMKNFSQAGNANWRVGPGEANGGSTIYADLGNGFLVTKESYADFRIRAEVWLDTPANSGIFIRCADPQKITATNSYEVNIFDKRPDPSYGTGGIVNFAKVEPRPKAGGKWNVFEITAKGPQLIVIFNGTKTVDIQDSKFAAGPFALQYASGIVKFRKVEIKPL